MRLNKCIYIPQGTFGILSQLINHVSKLLTFFHIYLKNIQLYLLQTKPVSKYQNQTMF